MSNIATHSARHFDSSKHFLRQDIIFSSAGAHLILKWIKTMQDYKAYHIFQMPEVDNGWLCPVRSLKALLASRLLPSYSPLFANNFPNMLRSLKLTFGILSKLFLKPTIFPTLPIDFTHFADQGPPLHLTTTFPFITS